MIDKADTKPLGKDGEKIPVIGLGTWKMGGSFHPDHSKDEQWINAIQSFCNLSIKKLGQALIDTAEMYGAGHTEELVRDAIKSFERDALFIITKVSASHLRKDQIFTSARKSRERLQVDQIDLYLIHWPNQAVPLKETMKAMEKLVKEGIVRHIGVSNFGIGLLEEARSYLNSVDIVLNQVKYSLMDRAPERALLPYCQREGITLMAYTPLELGRLCKNRYLNEVGKKLGKSPVQIALNWLICKEKVVTIVKSEKKKHQEENLRALGWRLDQKIYEEISHHFK